MTVQEIKDMALTIIRLRSELDEVANRKKELDAALEESTAAFNEVMESNDLKDINIDGVGRLRPGKGRLYATILKENEGQLFAYLQSIGRDDLIKPSVHPSSLSSFAAQTIETGIALPEFINTYIKPSVTFTKDKEQV